MSVTNAISGIIIIGGMLQIGAGAATSPRVLGALAVLLAAINIAGGFLVTAAHAAMFRKSRGGEHVSGSSSPSPTCVAGVLFIRSLGGLSKQETARRGNLYGIARHGDRRRSWPAPPGRAAAS